MTKLDQTAGVLPTKKAQVSNSALSYCTLQAQIASLNNIKTDFTFFINKVNVTISFVVSDISAFVLVIESLAVLNPFHSLMFSSAFFFLCIKNLIHQQF